MSSCVLEAKREYFGSPVFASSASSSKASSSAAQSPILLEAHDRDQPTPPLDEHYYHSPGSPAENHTYSHQLATPEAAGGSSSPPPGSPNGHQQGPGGATRDTQPPPPPPSNVAAIYEQPLAKAVPQLAAVAASRHANPARTTTFRTAVQAPVGSAMTRTRGRQSSGRNSLESVESRLSNSSATYDLHEDEASKHHDQNHQRLNWPAENSIKVRYVSPPEVPPATSAVRQDDWHSVPLDDHHLRCHDDPGQLPKKHPCPTERSLSSIMMARLRGRPTSQMQRPEDQSDRDGRAQHRVSSPSALKSGNLCFAVDATGAGGQPVKSASAVKDKLAGLSGQADSSASRRASKSFSIGSAGSGSTNMTNTTSATTCKQQIGKRQAPFMFAGILGSILGSVFFSMGILTIKLLPDGHGLAEKTKIACSRGAIMMVLCSASIFKSKGSFLVPRDEIFINVLRSVFGFMGIYMSYMSLKYISLGDATALVFSSPVWTSLLSHYILHEPLQWIQLLALPLSLLGIVLIAHPSLLVNVEHRTGQLEKQPLLVVDDVLIDRPFTTHEPTSLVSSTNNNSYTELARATASVVVGGGLNGTTTSNLDPLVGLNPDLDIATNLTEHFDVEHRWKGVVIALATSFIVSLVYIVLKFRKNTPIQTATFWLAFTTMAGSLFMGLFVGLGEFPTRWTELGLLLMNGVCSWLGQCLLQWALAYEDASVLSVVRTLDVAMSFSLSAIFLHEEIMWTSILGAAIIATVVVSIMLSNYIQAKLCSARPEILSPPLPLPAPTPLSSQKGIRFSISSAGHDFGHFNNNNRLSQASVQFKNPTFGTSNKSPSASQPRAHFESPPIFSKTAATAGA